MQSSLKKNSSGQFLTGTGRCVFRRCSGCIFCITGNSCQYSADVRGILLQCYFISTSFHGTHWSVNLVQTTFPGSMMFLKQRLDNNSRIRLQGECIPSYRVPGAYLSATMFDCWYLRPYGRFQEGIGGFIGTNMLFQENCRNGLKSRFLLLISEEG